MSEKFTLANIESHLGESLTFWSFDNLSEFWFCLGFFCSAKISFEYFTYSFTGLVGVKYITKDITILLKFSKFSCFLCEKFLLGKVTFKSHIKNMICIRCKKVFS